MYVYIYIYIYTHAHIYFSIYIFMYIYLYIYIQIYRPINILIYRFPNVVFVKGLYSVSMGCESKFLF